MSQNGKRESRPVHLTWGSLGAFAAVMMFLFTITGFILNLMFYAKSDGEKNRYDIQSNAKEIVEVKSDSKLIKKAAARTLEEVIKIGERQEIDARNSRVRETIRERAPVPSRRELGLDELLGKDSDDE